MAGTLVLIEHDRQRVTAASLRAITLAQQLSEEISLLVIGQDLAPLARSLAGYGARAVLVADDARLAHAVADRYAFVVVSVARAVGAHFVLAASSTFSKDILPRAAALLDAAMASDVIAVEEHETALLVRRPVYAGNAVATVRIEGAIRVLTVRAAAFAEPTQNGSLSPIEPVSIDAAALPADTEFLSQDERQSDRPELTEARVVVSGGRPLKDRATFDRLVGGLADVLGGAVGTTRAAVDAGIVPNDWQIGQTGKVISPDLYIAVGVSGAIQHLAGIKDSRVIVAINKDADAPIFQVATYGLVADLHEAVPQLIEAIARLNGFGPSGTSANAAT